MNDTRASALADFDDAHQAFRDVIAGAPEASLSYLKSGDDYALGGLVHHVNAVLEHYLVVLEAIIATDFMEAQPRHRPMLFQKAAAQARKGLAPGERVDALAATDRLHRAVSQRIADLEPQQFERHAPVRFEGAVDPYPTSAADILGWLTGHYQEHVPHADRLLTSWHGR